MNKKDQKRFDKLMEASRNTSFEAAEAMDCGDLYKWTKLQYRAEGLRKKGKEIESKMAETRSKKDD